MAAAVRIGAAAEPPDDPPAAAAPSSPSPTAQNPELGNLELRMGRKRLIYLYAPTVTADPGARAVLYFSGDWGWRPLQSETATYLAANGRYVVGIDAAEYFDRLLEPDDWRRDLETLRSYVNGKAGKPPDTPVLLMGYTFGGELIPYMLNRGGTKGFGGALLISIDSEGAAVFRASVQLRLASPPQEAFGVAEEIHRLPRSFPVFLMDGALHPESALRSIVSLVRGPVSSVTIEDADRQFHKVRGAYLAQVVRALAWLEGRHPEPGAPGAAAPAAGARPAEPPGGR